MRRRRPRSRGFSIIEMTVSFALISITLAVVSGAFLLSHRAVDRVRQRDHDIAGVRRLARVFRMDVARAQTVRIDQEGQQCELQVDGRAIRYESGGSTLRRTLQPAGGGPVQRDRFFARSCDWRFEHSGPQRLVSLTVTPQDGPTFAILAAQRPVAGLMEEEEE